MSNIIVNSIQHQNILDEQYLNLTENNEIAFSSQGIAVIYGPNGVGKTTLTKALSCSDETSHFTINYNGNDYVDDENLFHIVEEQRNRNIIKGETQDFILGDDIRREYELKAQLDAHIKDFTDRVVETLKTFGISSKSSVLFQLLIEKNYVDVLKEFANKANRGKDFTSTDICNVFSSLTLTTVDESEEYESKMKFFISDYSNKHSVIKRIETIAEEDLHQKADVVVIEQNDDAIEILRKYSNVNHCIVCDNPNICPEEISEQKQENNQRILSLLSEKIKSIIESIKMYSPITDPFNIKNIIIEACDTGNIGLIESLLDEFNSIKEYYIKKLENQLYEDFSMYNIKTLNDEYEALIEDAITLTDADELVYKANYSRKYKK